jgi:apolipoprotein N-acyltransferase
MPDNFPFLREINPMKSELVFQPILAESDSGIGWGIVFIFLFLGKWGWIVGLALLAWIASFRRSRSVLYAVFLVLGLTSALLLLALSVAYYTQPFVRSATLQPNPEVRPAVGSFGH